MSKKKKSIEPWPSQRILCETNLVSLLESLLKSHMIFIHLHNPTNNTIHKPATVTAAVSFGLDAMFCRCHIPAT